MGKQFHEIMGWDGPMTHRQFLVWQRWLDQQDNTPSRSDHYAMQIAAEVAKTRAKHPNQVKLDGFKLVFVKQKTNKKKGKPLTKQGKNSLIEQMWINRMSAPITIKREGQPDEIILPAKLQIQESIKKQQQIARQSKKPKSQPDTKNFPKLTRQSRRNRGNTTGT